MRDRVPRSLRAPSFSRVIVAVLASCTVDSEDGQTGFGPTTNPTSFTTTTMTATTVDPTESTTDAVSTTTPADDDDGSTGGSDGDGETTMAGGTTGGVDEQPDNGMYSHCTSVAQCVGLNICIVVAVDDGYCSTTPCADASVCVASPGGTAVAACVDVMVGMSMSTACALDCSAGKTCPGGMICSALGAAMVCT
jgi:hypothetical protein